MAQGLGAHVAFAKGSKFDSQHPHGGSQPPITPVPGDLTLLSDLHELLHTDGTHTYTQACTHTSK